MIYVFELTWTGRMHAPGNSATIQTIALALPDEPIRIYAEAAHLAELQRDPELTKFASVSFHAEPDFPHMRGKTHIVSPRRFAHEFLAIWTAVSRGAGKGERNLVMLISATSTAIFAALWAMKLWPSRNVAVQIGLHGNLNDIRGWRSRNPLLRRFDLNSALGAAPCVRLRFLVLEESIRTELAKIHPAAARRTDVLPLPINLSEVPSVKRLSLETPVRFGYVGLATPAKGIDMFLDLARAAKAKHGAAVEFHLVGSLMPGEDAGPYAILDSPASLERLSRAEFAQRLSNLHYVVLPYREGYYDLSASGALIDAVTWLKPVIAIGATFVRQMAQEFGDIGFICADADELAAAVDDAMSLDQNRYDRQRVALEAARANRSPESVATAYRRSVQLLYGG